MDVIIPKNNERELIAMAEKLGETKLILLYGIDEFKEKKINFNTSIDLHKGLIIKEEKDTNRIPPDAKYVFAKNPTRKMIESKKITHYFALEDQKKADFIHHRNSGMNQVYAAFMAEREKTYCFSYRLLLRSKRKDQMIGRFAQNKILIDKHKIQNHVFSFAKEPYEFRAKHERDALLSILR